MTQVKVRQQVVPLAQVRSLVVNVWLVVIVFPMTNVSGVNLHLSALKVTGGVLKILLNVVLHGDSNNARLTVRHQFLIV